VVRPRCSPRACRLEAETAQLLRTSAEFARQPRARRRGAAA
jgi:hypothetical protein